MAKRVTAPLTRAQHGQLLRDLQTERDLCQDTARQRNDALGALAQANNKIVVLEAKLQTANQANTFLRRQVGDVLEMCGSLLRS